MNAIATPTIEQLLKNSFAYRPMADVPGAIMMVSDGAAMERTLAEALEQLDHHVAFVSDSRAALRAIIAHPPDLVIFDSAQSDSECYTICAALKHNPGTWRIPVILMTRTGERATRLRGIESEADCWVQKPFDRDELVLRVRTLLRAKRRNESLEHVEAVIFALARTVEAKDAYTEGHLRRLVEYSQAIGERLELRVNDLKALCYGALLHDVGKVGVDEMIIRKGGPLTPAERLLMQQHPIIGERIVQPLHLSAAVGPIVRHHHERWDGTGYPDRLAGDGIPHGARIVAVADAFDAMTTQRPYNRIFLFAEAAARLRAGAGSMWDPRVVGIFLDWLVGMKLVV